MADEPDIESSNHSLADSDPEATSHVSNISVLASIGLAIILGVGAVGWLTGSGWFSYRTILYGSGELYAINLGDQSRTITIDGRGPETIPPSSKGYFDLVGGTSTVDIGKPDGPTLETLSVRVDDSDALVKVSDKGCLAAVDISFLYSQQSRPEQLPILSRIERDQRVYVPGTRHVVWPRTKIPKTLTGAETDTPKAVWIETCGCELLKSDNTHMLDTYLSVQLQARLNESTERRRPRP